MTSFILILTLCLAFVFGVPAGTEAVLTGVERASHPAPGKLISTPSGTFHVLTYGTSGRQAVLIHGFGTQSPVSDFGALAQELAVDGRVAVIENLGYGWSGEASQKRSLEQVIDDWRSVLKEAGLPGPYWLVPHSLGHLGVLLWTSLHPDEVAGVVSLDGTVPEQSSSFQADAFGPIPGILRGLGWVRIALSMNPSLLGPLRPDYHKSARDVARRVTMWRLGNSSQWMEYQGIIDQERATTGLVFPPSIPVRMVLSSEMVARAPEMVGLDWKAVHLRQIEGHPNAQLMVFEGGHFIHWNHAQEIGGILREAERSSRTDNR